MHDFTRPVDIIDEAAYKVAFLSDFFTQPLAPNQEPFLSSDGCQGISLILSEIHKTMLLATTAIMQQRTAHREVQP